MEQIIQWLTMNIDKLTIWLSGTTLGGITLWKLGSFIVSLIKNGKTKKYLAKIEEIKIEFDKKIIELKDFTTQVAHEQAQEIAQEFIDTFNRVQAKNIEAKEKIYNEIFNKKMEIEEIIEDFGNNIEVEITPVINENDKVEEVINDEPIIENKGKIEDEITKNKIDLL